MQWTTEAKACTAQLISSSSFIPRSRLRSHHMLRKRRQDRRDRETNNIEEMDRDLRQKEQKMKGIRRSAEHKLKDEKV